MTESLTNFLAQALDRNEREAVQGDLEEVGIAGWRGVLDVLGLVARRQLNLWKNWRPWLAAFGLALPGSLLLMGVSVSVSHAYQQFLDPTILKATGLTLGPGLWLLLCNAFLLIGWSWTGGFVLSSISRRTLWVSAALSFLPCMFCFGRFHIDSLSRFCLFLFLLPAAWGVYRGMQIAKIRLSSALMFAIAVTLLTVPTWTAEGPWIPNWALSWPVWYLVATARKSA